MKSWQNLVVVATVLSLTACGTELTRRYKSMTTESRTTGAPLVHTSAFVVEGSKSGEEPGVLQLSAEGQASLITAIAKVENSVTGLYQQLAKGFAKQPSIDKIDRSQMNLRVVFSTQKTELVDGPADRVSRLEFNLVDLPDNLQFSQWNRFETEYGQVDLGKIGLKKGTTMSVKLSPAFGGALNAGEAGVTGLKELSEEIAFRQRYIALTGTLDTHRATLIQEGAAGIDLSGNTSIDLTIKFAQEALELQDVVMFDSFRTSNGLKNPDEVSYRVIAIQIPKYGVLYDRKYDEGIRCLLTGSYVLRHVRRGDETISEGDDMVVFVRGELEVTPRYITLMSNEQLKQMRERFYIHRLGKEGESLAIDHPRNSNQPLDFATYEEAGRFLDWVSRQNAITVGGRELKLNQRPLARSDIANFRIGIRK